MASNEELANQEIERLRQADIGNVKHGLGYTKGVNQVNAHYAKNAAVMRAKLIRDFAVNDLETQLKEYRTTFRQNLDDISGRAQDIYAKDLEASLAARGMEAGGGTYAAAFADQATRQSIGADSAFYAAQGDDSKLIGGMRNSNYGADVNFEQMLFKAREDADRAKAASAQAFKAQALGTAAGVGLGALIGPAGMAAGKAASAWWNSGGSAMGQGTSGTGMGIQATDGGRFANPRWY